MRAVSLTEDALLITSAFWQTNAAALRAGGAVTPELEETMSASGFDLERLHRCLLSARRRAPARDH